MESKTWKIEFKPSAFKALCKLPPAVGRRLGTAIGRLAAEPKPPEARKLAGPKALYRIRVDDYRIVYKIEERMLTVLIVRVGDRKEIYRQLGRL